MKANQKFKNIATDTSASSQLVASVVVILISLVIGIMVYYEVDDGIDAFDEVTETFTGYTLATSNDTATTITLGNSPDGTTNCNVTCYNSTAKSESYPSYSLSTKRVSFAAEAADEFSQINVTYTSKMSGDAGETTDMATTVFALAPIIVLVLIASVILAVVLGFGGSKGGGL